MNAVNARVAAVGFALPWRLCLVWKILWTLALAGPAAAARLLALTGVPDQHFVYLHNTQAILGQLVSGGTLRLQPWRERATAAAAWHGQVLIFSGSQAHVVSSARQAGERWPFESEVRDAVVVGDRIAVLVGGVFRQGVLRGARVLLWSGPPAPAVCAPQVNSAWDPFSLRAAPGRPELLVAMRKTTHFDSVERPRPFLYRLADGVLRPIWKGTSFSHPFVDTVLVSWPSEPHLVTCALEELADGSRAVLAYGWTGATMEAVARSAPGRLGSALQATAPGEVGLFETKGRRWRPVVLGAGNKTDPQDVRLLQPVAAGPWLAQRPKAWTIVSRGSERWLVYAGPDGGLDAVRLGARISGLPD